MGSWNEPLEEGSRGKGTQATSDDMVERISLAWREVEEQLRSRGQVFAPFGGDEKATTPLSETKAGRKMDKSGLARLVEGSDLPLTKLAQRVWEIAFAPDSGSRRGAEDAGREDAASTSKGVTPSTIRNRIINSASRKAYVPKAKRALPFGAGDSASEASPAARAEDELGFDDDLMEDDSGSVWLRWEVRRLGDLGGAKEDREMCARTRADFKRAAKLHGKIHKALIAKSRETARAAGGGGTPGRGAADLDSLASEVEALARELKHGPIPAIPAQQPPPPNEASSPDPLGANVAGNVVAGSQQPPSAANKRPDPTSPLQSPPSAKRSRLSPEEAAARERAREEQRRLREEEKARKKKLKEEEQRAREEERARKKMAKENEQRLREEEKRKARAAKEEEKRTRDAERERARVAKEEEREREKAKKKEMEEKRKKKALGFFQRMGVQSKNRSPAPTIDTKARARPTLAECPTLLELDSALVKTAPPNDAGDLLSALVDRAKRASRARPAPVHGQPPPFSRRRSASKRGAGVSVASWALTPDPEAADASNLASDLGKKKKQAAARCWRRKLLQFCENRRPAYYGSVACPLAGRVKGRTPLMQVPGVDYEVDSEGEWESEPEGEDLADSDMSEEEDLPLGDMAATDSEDEARDFVVSDLSEDEEDDDDEDDDDEDEEEEEEEGGNPGARAAARAARAAGAGRLERMVAASQRRAAKLVVTDRTLLASLDPIWRVTAPSTPPPAAQAQAPPCAAGAADGKGGAKTKDERSQEAPCRSPPQAKGSEAGGSPKPGAGPRQLRMTDFGKAHQDTSQRAAPPPTAQTASSEPPVVVVLED